jgi:hypothetical protein
MVVLVYVPLLMVFAVCADEPKRHECGNSVHFGGALQIDTMRFTLNGCGIRQSWWCGKPYVAGLYLLQRESSPRTILATTEPMVIRLEMLPDIVGCPFLRGIRRGFRKATGGTTRGIDGQIDQLITTFDTLKVHEVYDLFYRPGKGLTIYKNRSPLHTIIGMERAFREALFGIWLSDRAVDRQLKHKLLGG